MIEPFPSSQRDTENISQAPKIKDILVNGEPLLFKELWKKTVDDWIRILSDAKFTGNPYNAAEYLFHFCRGMQLVIEKMQHGGLEIPQIPQLAIVDSDVPSLAFNGRRETGSEVVRVAYLKIQTLELFSPYDVSEPFEASFKKDVIFKGTFSSMARNNGIEEAHHCIFNQFKGSGKYVFSEETANLATYDADDSEYRALLQQLSITVKENDRPETIQILKERVNNATQLRNPNSTSTK